MISLSTVKEGHIAKKRDEKVDELTVEYDTSAKWILNELAKVARLGPRKFFHPDGSPRDITELDDESAASIAGFGAVELFDGCQGDQKRVTGLVKKFKLANRLRALELMGKHRAMFTDEPELSRPDGAAIPVELIIDL